MDVDLRHRLLSAQLIVADNQQRLLIHQLLADEINQILYVFELALTAAADMLDTPVPCTNRRHFTSLNDKPQQKGLDTPVAHDRIS
jgi:hypothetical protein